MHTFLLALIYVCLAAIAYQDFKGRTVMLLALLLLLAACVALSSSEGSLRTLYARLIPTGFFLLLLLSVLLLYYRLKGEKITAIADRKIGWGDLIFLLAVIPLFSLVGFILFFLSSLVITLIGTLTYRYIRNDDNGQTLIPLAGIQAVFLLGALTLNEVFWKQTYTGGFLFADILWIKLQNMMGAGI